MFVYLANGNVTAEDRKGEVYVECALYIDGAPFGLPMRTRFVAHDPINVLLSLFTCILYYPYYVVMHLFVCPLRFACAFVPFLTEI